MQRILQRGEIETLAQRDIPRLRRPDRADVFAARARRLRQLSDDNAIGDYLRLMAALADAQQDALARCDATRELQWRAVLQQLCDDLAVRHDFPSGVREMCEVLRSSRPELLEQHADALLASLAAGSASLAAEADVGAAPFVIAALQVYWVDLASRQPVEDATAIATPGVCPFCRSLPVASVVRSDSRSNGYRYLHCALCATEWHMVRVTCSHCQSTRGISYQSIEGRSEAIRAECCESCRTYRKILYQEKDVGVEPVADDLASLALDLLLADAGYYRSSGNPLLWQPL